MSLQNFDDEVDEARYAGAGVSRATVVGTDARPPIARNDDPENAHVAAALIEPRRGTRKAQVLDRLLAARGEWVDGWDLRTQECGGSEGLRRLRELREADGWPIEERPIRGGSTAWQYRLVVDR